MNFISIDKVMLIASSKVNFLELLKILTEDDKKPSSKVKTPSSSANINILGKGTSLHILDTGYEELNIFRVLIGNKYVALHSNFEVILSILNLNLSSFN